MNRSNLEKVTESCKLAQAAESAGKFQEAFGFYKTAIEVLNQLIKCK